MQINGTPDAAAKAIQMMVELLLDSKSQKDAKKDPNAAATPTTDYSVKLLIHKFLAGCIIGKGGELIRDLQTQTGTRIQLSTAPIGNSTEKTVTIKGTPEGLYVAVVKCLSQLHANPLKKGCSSVLYTPGDQTLTQTPPPPNPYTYPPPTNYALYGPPPTGYSYPPPTSSYGAPQHFAASYVAPTPAAPSADAKTEKIVIPTVCVGSVIGRGGTIIAEIKKNSGTFISIADPETSAPQDRIVSITGTPTQIQMAIHYIRQRVEQYQPPSK